MGETGRWTPRPSAWQQTAVRGPETKPIGEPLTTHSLIIGAGYAGLNAALRLLERSIDVVVIDAGEIGVGASGRNGGQVVPGLKHDPDHLLSVLGESRGQRLIEFAGRAADDTFATIKKHGLTCDADQRGWLQPAVDRSTLALVTKRARSWSSVTGRSPKILDAREVRGLTGSDFYCGGWIDDRGGQLQPLSYVRELGRRVVDLGGRVHHRSTARHIRRIGDGWEADVNGHVVRSKMVLVCTNGHVNDLVPSLRRSLVPASSVMIATEPLPDALRQQVMPSKLPISDARRIMNYVRYDDDGRVLIGARGSFGLHEPASDFDALKKAALRIFPQLKGIAWSRAWGGLFCLTKDFLPHVHNPEPGLFALAGCNGRGVAIMSQLGGLLGDLSASKDFRNAAVPATPIRQIPFHRLRRIGLEAVLMWYRILDRLHV